MAADEIAFTLNTVPEVSKITLLLLGKRCDRIYHTAEMLRTLPSFSMVSLDEETGKESGADAYEDTALDTSWGRSLEMRPRWTCKARNRSCNRLGKPSCGPKRSSCGAPLAGTVNAWRVEKHRLCSTRSILCHPG